MRRCVGDPNLTILYLNIIQILSSFIKTQYILIFHLVLLKKMWVESLSIVYFVFQHQNSELSTDVDRKEKVVQNTKKNKSF